MSEDDDYEEYEKPADEEWPLEHEPPSNADDEVMEPLPEASGLGTDELVEEPD